MKPNRLHEWRFQGLALLRSGWETLVVSLDFGLVVCLDF
jgi:hypothetical protein